VLDAGGDFPIEIGVCDYYPPEWLDSPTEHREFIRIGSGTDHLVVREVWNKNRDHDAALLDGMSTGGFSCSRKPDVIRVLGTSWKDGVAFRETNASIDERYWVQAEKEWKVIVMH
jgi:hypothetical protein